MSPRAERPPEWAPVPPPAGHPVAVGLAYLASGVAIAAFLWLKGAHVPAAILAALLAIGLTTSVLSSRFAAVADRAREWVQGLAGRALSFTLLSAVQILVFLPAWLVLRALRIDPLQPATADSDSLWIPTRPRRGRPLDGHQFTYEPDRILAGAGGRRPRVRAAVGLLAILIALDLAAGAVLHHFDDSGDGGTATAAGRQSLLFFPHIAASRGAPWLPELATEIDRVWYAKHYDPFLGWRMPATSTGRWLNIKDGARRSYVPPGGSGRTVRVVFLGGSTMFGLFERDDYTIPSQVARLAARDGIRVRAVNLGQMAYNNWQDTLLLAERLTRARPPDLVVFYDGNNELVGQFRLGPHRAPAHQETQEYAKRIGYGASGEAPPVAMSPSRVSGFLHGWKNLSAVTWLERRLRGVPTEFRPAAQPLTSAWVANQRGVGRAAGLGAAAVYSTGVRFARTLARGDGFPVRFFWQPIIYSKPRLPGERQAIGALGTDPAAWTEADRVARGRLPAGVFDISGALDAVRVPVMYDFVHTNELGARVIAEAMYRRLHGELLRLRAGGRR